MDTFVGQSTMDDHAGRRRFRRSAFSSIVLALLACGSGADDSTSSIPRPTPLRIQDSPVLSVGVVEGDANQQFDRVVTPFLLSDGRLVVPVAGAGTIRIFAPNGDFVASFGRPGAGPGEFRSLLAAWSRGDTIEAFDNRLRRITRFLPNGAIEIVALETRLPDLSAVAGPVPEGWIVGGVADAGMGRRDAIVLRVFARDGSEQGEIARVAGFARYAVEGLGGGPEPLSPRALMAVSNGFAYVAETLTPRIEVRTPAGALEREITWPSAPTASPRAVFHEVVDTAVARAPADRATATRQRLEAAPIPEQLSVFWNFMVDDEGFIWVRPFEPRLHAAALGGLSLAGGGAGGSWTVLSAGGAEVASLEVPAELEPLRITADAVVGIVRDSLGVESVRVHRLVRR